MALWVARPHTLNTGHRIKPQLEPEGERLMREVERAQSGCSQGQKSSISALWAQTEVTWSALLLLETQQMGGPTFSRMFLGSKWPTHKLLFNCLDHLLIEASVLAFCSAESLGFLCSCGSSLEALVSSGPISVPSSLHPSPYAPRAL